MANENGKALDWDSEVQNDGQGWQLLPESEAQFEVLELTKATSTKLNCPMAKLRLKVWNEHGETEITEHLVLHTTCEWKLCEFFRAIGQREHGAKLRPRWNEVVGSHGRLKVVVEKYTKRDNTVGEANKVKHFLDPVGAAPAAAGEPNF